MRPKKATPSLIAAVALTAMVVLATLTTHPGRETAGPLPNGSPPDQQVTIDGKTYTKTARQHIRLTAKDLQLAHEGTARHAVGRAFTTNFTWNTQDPSYIDNDWWMEGEAYILHRQELLGNPPIQSNYYRAGFELWSWRGVDAYDNVWGDTETPALNQWDIWFNLIKHPLGGTLTTNLNPPLRVHRSNPGNYSCAEIGPEIFSVWDPQTVIRTNLIVRPRWMYWDSASATFRLNPYNQVRRMTHSRGLIADGADQNINEAYTNIWSGSVSIPAGGQDYSNCAPEVIQEP